MTDKEIEAGFALLGLSYLSETPYKGYEEFVEKFEMVSVLKDVEICIGSTSYDCNSKAK